MNYFFRKAGIKDIEFISKVIIEAEKSGSTMIGLANILETDESTLKEYLIKILEEKIDGCEFSLSSFVIAEYNDTPVAAFGGWIEGENEDGQPSSQLKSNLIGFLLPKEKLFALKNKSEAIKGIAIERELQTHQLEYAFVIKEQRGNHLINLIIDELLKIAKKQNSSIKKSQVQVFENNTAAVRVYENSGYKITKRVESKNPETLKYFPFNVKLLMEKEL